LQIKFIKTSFLFLDSFLLYFYSVLFIYAYVYMSDKLSLLMLNPFSSESVDNSFKFDWLKKYNLKYHW